MGVGNFVGLVLHSVAYRGNHGVFFFTTDRKGLGIVRAVLAHDERWAMGDNRVGEMRRLRLCFPPM